jgi:branched-chain amino acid transport system permease protein
VKHIQISPKWVLGAFLFCLLLAPFVLSAYFVTLLNYIGLYSLVALGLVLLTGVGGLTSFGQAAFVGIGAYTTAYLTTAQDLPMWIFWIGQSTWLSLLSGILITCVIAYFVGLISLRLSGHFLPLGTIAWGISIYFLFGNLEPLGGHTGITSIPAVGIFGLKLEDPSQYYYLIWIFVLAAIFATSNLLNSREGRAIRALKGGIVMAESMGVDTARSRMAIFLIAATFASTSGWLYAHLQRFVNPTPFGIHIGIEYLFMAVVGGAGHVWGAILGATLLTTSKQWLQDLLPQILGSSGNFEAIVFGILMVVVLQKARNGLWPILQRYFPVKKTTITINSLSAALSRKEMPPHGEVILEVKDVTKRFGGLIANNQMNLSVKAGEILALIGPNGAGKSTMFNQISGVDTPTSGEVLFCGEAISKKSPAAIAELGMSRTFQHVKILPGMTVLENVAIGLHLRGSKGIFAAVTRLDRKEEARLLAEAAAQVERVGLKDRMFLEAGSLALGQQRILEIARALCADPCLLLLDEPAAGLRYKEKEALATLLTRLRSEGMAILLVEHDMDFVMGLVNRIVVMEFGQKIAEGSPEEIQSNPVVLEAYLGGVEA